MISIHLMLMLISKPTNYIVIYKFISIHLMLMLIIPSASLSYIRPNFNTSHVNVNRKPSNYIVIYKLISIHLMLMLICMPETFYIYLGTISIHLMLMLIHTNLKVHNNHIDFNTSHVNVNRVTEEVHNGYFKISIHLMLMLINLVV